jgi:hypothetical protein
MTEIVEFPRKAGKRTSAVVKTYRLLGRILASGEDRDFIELGGRVGMDHLLVGTPEARDNARQHRLLDKAVASGGRDEESFYELARRSGFGGMVSHLNPYFPDAWRRTWTSPRARPHDVAC